MSLSADSNGGQAATIGWESSEPGRTTRRASGLPAMNNQRGAH